MESLSAAFLLLGMLVQPNTVYAKPPQQFASIEATITAYTSDPKETDATPDQTASMIRPYSGIVANNCLPFGSEVYIGGRKYEVQDRLHSKYPCSRFDVWKESKKEAVLWGKQKHKVMIFYLSP